VVVDNIATKHLDLVARGYEPMPIKEFQSDGTLSARFFFIQDPDGYKIEVLERYGHYQ
jgi:lactoylglutathione lyase